MDFAHALMLTRSGLGLLHVGLQIYNRIMALENFISPHYLENYLIEFDQILYMH